MACAWRTRAILPRWCPSTGASRPSSAATCTARSIRTWRTRRRPAVPAPRTRCCWPSGARTRWPSPTSRRGSSCTGGTGRARGPRIPCRWAALTGRSRSTEAQDPPWLTRDGVRCVIAVHAQPGARRSEVAGLHGNALKIRVHAPAVEGAANAALIAFLAKTLAVRQRDVEILSGEKSREKRIGIVGVDGERVVEVLGFGGVDRA
ncbi:MAG: YggU family protein [Betaproteobacteria bacterium]|nr:YggU family protein [Betaproteobacteria bacterium]